MAAGVARRVAVRIVLLTPHLGFAGSSPGAGSETDFFSQFCIFIASARLGKVQLMNETTIAWSRQQLYLTWFMPTFHESSATTGALRKVVAYIND